MSAAARVNINTFSDQRLIICYFQLLTVINLELAEIHHGKQATEYELQFFTLDWFDKSKFSESREKIGFSPGMFRT